MDAWATQLETHSWCLMPKNPMPGTYIFFITSNSSITYGAVEALFFIDKKGDDSKIDGSLKPIVPSHLENRGIETAQTGSVIRSKVIVPQDFPTAVDDEEENEDDVCFKGHSSHSPSDDSCYEISEDEYDSTAESDYIKNLEENMEENVINYLGSMNLDGFPGSDDSDDSSGSESDSQDCLDNDEEFARLANDRQFLLRSPSTIMEFALDETAAEFLNQKRRSRKGKAGPKGKKGVKLEKASNVADDLFEYDGPYTVGAINFRQLNRELKAFINDDIEDSLEMDPMPPLPRKLLHELAHMYGLKSKSQGQGRDRHCVLYKTEHSGIPRNVKQVRMFLDRAEKSITWMDKTVTKGKKFTKASVPFDVKKNRDRAGKGDGMPTKPVAGSVIGKDAKPISEDNVGNKLLQKMGWKPGEGLGSASDGIKDPLAAVYRHKRTGIGHDN